MGSSGLWADTVYASCSLEGARCQERRIRHDIEEIKDWPPMGCHHIHDRHGTEPPVPADEEGHTAAEAFALAVSVSWWALRRGRALARIPRFPAHCSVGNRSSRFSIPPQGLREWAMVPTALKLGLKAPGTDANGVPGRASVAEKQLHTRFGAPATLAENEIYIGAGHFSHRLKTTKWASPFIVGQDGSAQRCVALYMDHARSVGLLKDILELKGKTLICDCPEGILCTGDALALEFYATVSGKAIVESGNLTFCHEAGALESQSRHREVIPAGRMNQLAQIPPPMKVARP